MSARATIVAVPAALGRRWRLVLCLPALLALAACSAVRVHGTAREALEPAPIAAPAAGALAGAELRLRAAREAERAYEPNEWPEAALLRYLDLARWTYAHVKFARPAADVAAVTERDALLAHYDYATERFTELAFAHRERGRALLADDRGLALRRWRVRPGATAARLRTADVDLVAASHLRFDGLRTVYRRTGVGAAFVAAVASENASSPLVESPCVAATVLLRFAGATLEDTLAARDVELEVLDPTRAERVRIGGADVPLAADFTAPHALWLARAHFERQARFTLFRRASRLKEPRLYALEPYDAHREIVVLLHGLGSSPAAWANLVNEIAGDAGLRRRYQIWQVFYPTNLPPAENRWRIRQALADAFASLDPAGADAATRHVTLIGHSMGGVIARLLVLDSGDALWRELFGARFEHVRSDGDSGLDPYLTLAPLPQVDTAIFLAAPHRGSPLASTWRGKLMAHLVRLPATLIDKLKSISELVAREGGHDEKILMHPTSVRTLADDDIFLRATARLPITPGVAYHTIVGRKDPSEPIETSSDGVVPYASAHLAGAASELVVTSRHHVHETPEAIAQILRILRARPAVDAPASEAIARLDAPLPRPRGPDDRDTERATNVLAKN